jgi:hypothetical protein
LGFPGNRSDGEIKEIKRLNVWHGFCSYYFRAIPIPSACERGAHSYVEMLSFFAASVVGAFSVAVSLATLAVPASAQVDPLNIHVGPGAGVACDTGCAGLPNTPWATELRQPFAMGKPPQIIPGTPEDLGFETQE